MKFTDYLFNEVKDIWRGYLEHPFVKGIGEGTLDREKFKNYLIQDYLYLKDYAKVYAVGFTNASSIKEMKLFADAINGILDDEAAVHIKYLEDFGVSREEAENHETDITNISYSSYMLGIALKGDVKEIAVAALPCAWSYSFIGKNLYEKYNENFNNNFYAPWIESYASEEYTNLANKWIDYVNEICSNINEGEKKYLASIFKTASIHEMEFWNMAYGMKKWN